MVKKKHKDTGNPQQEAMSEATHAHLSRPISTMNDKWELLPAFLRAKGLMKQHIDSINYFMTTEMQQIVQAESNYMITSDVDPNYFIRWINCYVGSPNIEEDMIKIDTTPHLCRVRDLTYSAPIFCDVDYRRGNDVIRKKAVEIGRMPIMLQSKFCRLHGKSPQEMMDLKECPYDPGGYFIIRGVEKVLLMQEQLSNNRIIVETDNKGMMQAVVTSSTSDNKSRTVVCQVPNVNKMGLNVKHSSFVENIPVVIMLKAMGMESDQEIVMMIGVEEHYVDGVIPCFQDAHQAGVFSQLQAIDYLATRVKQRTWTPKFGAQGPQKAAAPESMEDKRAEAKSILRRQVLSHIPMKGPNDFASKLRYLCLMVRRVFDAQRNPKLKEDKDYYGNKRLELAGHLVSLLFEDLFKNLCTDLKRTMDTLLTKYFQSTAGRQNSGPPPDVFQQIPTERITRGLQHSISSGNWNIKRFRIDRSGVSQVLSRFSYISCLGAMTRVKSQFDKAQKVAGPRALQPSQWGMLCPADTPEGEQCGLIKHLSLMTHVTTNEDEDPLKNLCYCLGVEDANTLTGEELHSVGTFLIFLNGQLLGCHRRPIMFMQNLRNLRRRGKVGEFVSIYENEALNAIFVASDGGRLCRPLLVVENGKLLLQESHLQKLRDGEMVFGDFLRQGIVEWVDVNEENNLLVAIYERDLNEHTTHMEIDPLTLLGAVAGLIPHPNHNQSPRNTYQCAMGKQAMGCVAMNQFIRTDNILYLVCYPQKPLCKTKTIELINFEKLGAGQAASVAVMSYSGYDIEDASIMNKASIDRGYGRCMVMKRSSTQLQRYPNGAQDRLHPPPDSEVTDARDRRRAAGGPNKRRYGVLDTDGLVRVGESVKDGNILALKMSPANTTGDIGLNSNATATFRETPLYYKGPVKSMVDRVVVTQNADEVKTVKVMLRQVRRPELGDKFSSRHGQKGVVGLIVNQEDMPFSERGWCPDMIMNPHGFPSRMTVGKLMETIGGKAACMTGEFAYGTAFGGTPIEETYRRLMANGFSYSGKDLLHSGITGEPLECYIFNGPIYYQKLKHMVMDKIHARARGPRMVLTRQPTEGRSRDGGLRLGEMERDCLVSYGASNLLLERLMFSSDGFEAVACQQCGMIGAQHACLNCGTARHNTKVRLPYACKLLFQELQAMGICPRLAFKDRTIEVPQRKHSKRPASAMHAIQEIGEEEAEA